MVQRTARLTVVSIFLSLMLVATCVLLPASQAETSPARVVKNPYASVDWNTVTHYLANFHSHTVYSDGRAEPDELIHNYAEAGYHILAITDHDNHHTTRDGERETVRTASTTWPWTNWIGERPSQLWQRGGIVTSAFFPGLGEEGMLAVRGNELSTHPHIVSLFNDCGFVDPRSDDERMACVAAKGGLSHWAHPANYVPGGRWEDRVFDTSWEEALEYFGRYIADHDHMIGVEVRFGSRREREEDFINRLFDQYYRDHDIFMVGSDDTHDTSVSENAALTLLLAEALTEEAVRHALKNGHTFVGARTTVYPRFNRISVDDEQQTITVDVDNHDGITWYKDGLQVAEGDTVRFSGMKNAVLRFQLDVDNVVFYSQAFYID